MRGSVRVAEQTGSTVPGRLLGLALRELRTEARMTLDGAADNWWGPWPPQQILDEGGAVPVEERKRQPAS